MDSRSALGQGYESWEDLPDTEKYLTDYFYDLVEEPLLRAARSEFGRAGLTNHLRNSIHDFATNFSELNISNEDDINRFRLSRDAKVWILRRLRDYVANGSIPVVVAITAAKIYNVTPAMLEDARHGVFNLLSERQW